MFVGVCLVTMFLLMLIRHKLYGVKILLLPFLAVAVAIMGLLGTYIMFFIENGGWYGRSFFGAVLFFPILLLPVAVLFRMKLRDLLDYATPPGVSLLAIYKYNCFTDGCCGGKVLFYNDAGVPTYFPSQLAEMGTAVILVFVLLTMERNPKFNKKIYPLFLIMYGVIRYILNQYRWEQADFLFGLPAGNLWSIVAIAMGSVFLLSDKMKKGTIQ